jgi:hypothetical protein
MMRKTGVRLLLAASIAGSLIAGIGSPPAVTATAALLPLCNTSQLIPQLGATTVNQGVGSYSAPGAYLVRGKDTLVRFFLVNQSAVNSTCSGTTYIRSANLTVTNGAAPATYATAALQTFGTTGAAIPSSTVSVDSNADPKFVLPANVANSCLSTLACTDSAAFGLTFTVAITYSTSLSSTPVTLSPAVASTTATFDKSSNALRALAIPMGDKLQSYSGQFSDSARVAVENGFAALSRIYALPGGVSSTLNTLSGGVRYKLDLAAMLDLKAVSGAYDPNNKFCGTQANFDAGIKSQLAGFLSVYNTSITDTNQRADRVVGVVDKNISDGSTSAYNCAEAMASTNSPESWVRAIPDQPAGGGKPAVPSMTGSLMAMEIAHTFGMETGTLSFHSPNTQADGTAPDKAYNLSSRSYLADDRSTMRFVSANPFNNNNALFEKDDFEHMLCNLGGSLTGNCTAAATGTVVAAGPTFAIFGTTDFTTGGTKVLESYGSQNLDLKDAIFVASGGDLTLQFFDASNNKIGADITVPYSNKSSEHVVATNLNTTNAVFGGVFDAPAGYTKVKLVYNGTTTLYERSSATLEPVSAGIGTFAPGGSVSVSKTLKTPDIPPKPDVVFLADTTGSMNSALSDMKSNVAGIMNQVLAAQSQAQFGAANYKDFGCTPPGATSPETPFNLDQMVTMSTSAVQTAINTWSTVPGSGCDKPEAQLWALYQLATNSGVGWRAGSSRIIVWFGDAPGHDPSNGITQAAAISALNAAGIRVIAINLVNSGEGSSLDDLGQATAIVNATGGVLETRNSLDEVSSAILAGLANLPATVQPQVTTCDPNLSVAFDPAAKTVTSGQSVSFTETISIAGAATPGSTLTCTVQFPVNGLLPDDPAFTQTLSINVTGGSGLIATFKSANPAEARAHVVYDCGNGEKEPAFVALEGTQVAANIVQFQQNLDPSLSCANATGTASLTIVATNGVNAVSETVPTSSSTFPVADKAPSAAIYQPSLDAVIPYTSQFSLNGHVADPEDGNLTAHWAIVSAPASASIPSISDGDVVDVPPPPAGWPAGDYVIQLSGTDSQSHTATATVTVHVAHYAFAGFFPPVDNPPVLNIGKAGNTYPLKWSLTQNGTAVSDLSAVVALRFAGTGCGAQPADALETTASGTTVLRYDSTALQYVYNWQTPSTAGCYVVTLTLADGSTWPAFFQLK